MVCGLSFSDGFQPARPTVSRCAMKVLMGVSSRKKCVCMSITNWFFSESARAWATSRLAASFFSTS
jgi:hypothetical protein